MSIQTSATAVAQNTSANQSAPAFAKPLNAIIANSENRFRILNEAGFRYIARFDRKGCVADVFGKIVPVTYEPRKGEVLGVFERKPDVFHCYVNVSEQEKNEVTNAFNHRRDDFFGKRF